MAIVNKMELGRELSRTVVLLNLMADEVKQRADTMGIEAHKVMDSNGTLTLVPIIAAKAQCLHALAIINQRD